MPRALTATGTVPRTALGGARNRNNRRRRCIAGPERQQDRYRHRTAQHPHLINVTQSRVVHVGDGSGLNLCPFRKMADRPLANAHGSVTLWQNISGDMGFIECLGSSARIVDTAQLSRIQPSRDCQGVVARIAEPVGSGYAGSGSGPRTFKNAYLPISGRVDRRRRRESSPRARDRTDP
jgi:hypothetical protein